MFDEDWRRFVIKMATGSGKTKVLSLLLAWSYFHRLYEPDSGLSKGGVAKEHRAIRFIGGWLCLCFPQAPVWAKPAA